MNKVHFKMKDGRWYSYRDISVASYALPLCGAITLNKCIYRTKVYLGGWV